MNDSSVLPSEDPVKDKPRRGRPIDPNAMSGAKRQERYRERQKMKSVTVTINRDLIDRLDAQLVAFRDGQDLTILTTSDADALLRSIRKSARTQLISK
ncbi:MULTISPECIES: hypothetical protein [Aeromonas]|uniref:Uncharacterized protein n=1 Tax=Aeromonas caviae TaxID=648 RepID=A0AAJ5ZBM5_AERCA|nr:hypothetical protein [Aeromonas caviae]RWT81339.1 hypothetical protein DN604_00795 [Aeromonas caviae]WFG00346.1 hypothetical protein P5S46_21525 [Aeromonas caviae]WVM48064.1 hypothetical protein V0242_24300 [Aeromonas hydrophila]